MPGSLNPFKRAQSVLLMLPDGGMRIYAEAIRVARVMKDYPGYSVGSHNSSRLHLPPEKLLRPGNSYFLHAPSPRADSRNLENVGEHGGFRDRDDTPGVDKDGQGLKISSGKPWAGNESLPPSLPSHRPSTASRPSAPARANSAPRYSLDVRSDGRTIRRSLSAKDLQDVLAPPPSAPAPATAAVAPRHPPSRLGMRRSASAQNLAQPPVSVLASAPLYTQQEEEYSPQQEFPHHQRGGFHAKRASMDWQSKPQEWDDGGARLIADVRRELGGGDAAVRGFVAPPFAVNWNDRAASQSGPVAGRLTRRASLAMDMSTLSASPAVPAQPVLSRRLPPNFHAQDIVPPTALPPHLMRPGDARMPAFGGGVSKSQSFPDFVGLEGGDVAQRAQPQFSIGGSGGSGGSGDWGSGGSSPRGVWEEEWGGDVEGRERGGSRSFGCKCTQVSSTHAMPLQPPLLQLQQQQQQHSGLTARHRHPSLPTLSAHLPLISPQALSLSPSSPCHKSPRVFSPLAHKNMHYPPPLQQQGMW